MKTLREAGIRINHNSKHLKFVRWFERAGYRDEESAMRGFEFGYRLGYAAAKRRASTATARQEERDAIADRQDATQEREARESHAPTASEGSKP